MWKYLVLGAMAFGMLAAQNLLPNPGFESWTGGLPDGWFYGSNDDSILVFQEDVIVHGGNFSVKESLFTQNQDRADFQCDTFVVQPNVEYTFSIWVYDNDVAGRLRPAIGWHAAGNWTNSYGDTYSANSTNWQELPVTALAPAGADSAFVFVRAYDSLAAWDGDAIFYFDDASFTAASMQAPVIVRIWHLPTHPAAGVGVDVHAIVSDDGVIVADTLFYGVNSTAVPVAVSHSFVSGDTFQYLIPGQATGDTVFYWLRYVDDDGLSTASDTSAYFVGELGIVVNEVYYDAPGTDSGCYVEIYGPAGASLNGIAVVGVNGYNGTDYATVALDGYAIPSDGFFVIAQNSWVSNADTFTPDADWQNGPDNIEVRYQGIRIDAVGYGTLGGFVFTGETEPAVDVVSGHCLGRYPDGDDTDNNLIDFVDYDSLTPGEANPNPAAIAEGGTCSRSRLLLANPVRSGVLLAVLAPDPAWYPIGVYNSLGQRVQRIDRPAGRFSLPAGVYFLELEGAGSARAKIVVLD